MISTVKLIVGQFNPAIDGWCVDNGAELSKLLLKQYLSGQYQSLLVLTNQLSYFPIPPHPPARGPEVDLTVITPIYMSESGNTLH